MSTVTSFLSFLRSSESVVFMINWKSKTSCSPIVCNHTLEYKKKKNGLSLPGRPILFIGSLSFDDGKGNDNATNQ